jgi:glycosyltransferase involved in cell wall biosynthesis
MTPLCAATSMRILTVSEFSKSEIMRRLSIDGRKINVIYNAVSSQFYVPTNRCKNTREITGEKYILVVSSIDPRKNFSTLFKAFTKLKIKEL